MADTPLKFGPEWLRVLSEGRSLGSPPMSPGARYRLAEFRYGKEEMLALFSMDLSPPPQQNNEFYPALISKNAMLPVSLDTTTEDEQRAWSRSVNSDAVLRLANPRDSNISGERGGIAARGRSSYTDRGRGGGRGRTGYFRGSHEEGDGPPELYNSAARTRPFDRSQSLHEPSTWEDNKERRYDKSYTENWRMTGRGDATTGGGGGGGGTAAEDDGQRRARWGSGSARGNWRQDRDIDYDRDRDKERSSSFKNHRNMRREDGDGNLPEWSVDENSDFVGTFDSSGAFMEHKDNHHHRRYHDQSGDNEYWIEDGGEKMMNNHDDHHHPEDASSNNRPRMGGMNQDNFNNNTNGTVDHQPPPNYSRQNSVAKEMEPDIVKKQQPSRINQNNKQESRNEELMARQMHTKHLQQAILPPPLDIPSPYVSSLPQQRSSPEKHRMPPQKHDEDHFDHMEAENLVAKITDENEEERTKALDSRERWLYRDPHGIVQGPFASSEMMEWYSAGYFSPTLWVRRECDERFSQLGELEKRWGESPFSVTTNQPPIVRSVTQTIPVPDTPNPRHSAHSPVVNRPSVESVIPTPTPQLPSQQQQQPLAPPIINPIPGGPIPDPNDPQLALWLWKQQMMQQIFQQEMFRQQVQQLQQQDGYSALSLQQQQLLLSRMLSQQAAMGAAPMPTGDLTANQRLPLPGMNIAMANALGAASLNKDNPLLKMQQQPGPWMNQNVPPMSSVWDLDSNSPLQEALAAAKKAQEQLEEETRKDGEHKHREEESEAQRMRDMHEAEEKERLRRDEEELRRRREMEEEHMRRRRDEEERLKMEKQRRLEEESRRLDEERKQQEELRRLELERQEAERRRREDEKKRMEMEEERRRQAEILKMRKMEELNLLKKQTMEEEEIKRREMEYERQKELDLQRHREMEAQIRLQQEELQKMKDKKRNKQQAPAWGGHGVQKADAISLSDIQRAQEEKERKEREERLLQQLQNQEVLMQQQQQQAAQQQSKGWGLTWAQKSAVNCSSVKSLAEIQMEESEKQQATKQKVAQTKQSTTNLPIAAAKVWGNAASHLNWKQQSSASPQLHAWNGDSSSSAAPPGFWDDVVPPSKQPTSAKSNSGKQQTSISANSNAVHSQQKLKKDQEAVMKIFNMHSEEKADDFTQWCKKILGKMNTTIDIPVFVAFLMTVESPYEVHDYVRSYLGDTKEAKAFAKQFMEKRSKQRNQSKFSGEENMWGPAPAILPSQASKSSGGGVACGGTGSGGSGGCSDSGDNFKPVLGKKKNKGKKVDNSFLGFTVNPSDRINAGEIDHGDNL